MARELPLLEDDVLVLRRWREADIPEIVEACQDADIVRWISQIPTPYGEKEAREFLALTESGREDWTFLAFAITERVSERVLGSISVTLKGEVGEVGYYVCADVRRRGIGTRALRIVSRWALDELGLARLQLVADVGNTASAGLAEKLGYRREGVLRAWLNNRGTRADVIMYSLLPGEVDQRSGDE